MYLNLKIINDNDNKLRAPVRKNQTYRGKGGKFDFFHILMSDRLGYNFSNSLIIHQAKRKEITTVEEV